MKMGMVLTATEWYLYCARYFELEVLVRNTAVQDGSSSVCVRKKILSDLTMVGSAQWHHLYFG